MGSKRIALLCVAVGIAAGFPVGYLFSTRLRTGTVVRVDLSYCPTEKDSAIRKRHIDSIWHEAAYAGNTLAASRLASIAFERTNPIDDRVMAARLLATTPSRTAAQLAAGLLLCDDPDVRCAAYYALPKELRIEEYNYMLDPDSPISRQAVEMILAKIPNVYPK